MVLARRLLLCTLSAVLACTGSSALAAEPTKTPLTFEVVVGPNDDTHCKVTADLYRPAGASKARAFLVRWIH